MGWANGVASGFEWHKLSRIPHVAKTLVEQLLPLGGAGVFAISTFTTTVAALVAAQVLWQRSLRGVAFPLVGFLLHLGLYATALAFTSRDFGWHLTPATPRLAVRFLPEFLLMAACLLGPKDSTRPETTRGATPAPLPERG